jgi:tetratricopeptide (TPR) repeat protein
LPAALLVLFWWQRGRLRWRSDVGPLVPWFLLATVSGLFTAWVERHLIGAEGAEFHLDFLQRALLAARVICFYLAKLYWPAKLSFTYPHGTIDPAAVASYGFTVAVAGLVIALWKLRTRTRAPLAAFLIFSGSLFPVLGFFNIYPFRYSYVADHFQYLPSVALVVATAAALSWLLERSGAPLSSLTGRLAVAALLGLLGTLTWRQSRTYADAETLDRATLARNPDSWKEHNNLGRLLARSQRRMSEAIPHYEAAIRLKPDHLLAHYSLGVALYVTGRPLDAIAHFRRVLELSHGQTLIVANSHFLLGAILAAVPGRLSEATAQLEEALRMKPNDPEVVAKLAEVRAERALGRR